MHEDLSRIAFFPRPAYCPRAATGSPGSPAARGHPVSPHAWGLRLRRTACALALFVCSRVAFWSSDAMGVLKHAISKLNTQPTGTLVQRFRCSLTTVLAWLGARVVRYAFPVRLLLLHAGLSRRYPDEGVRQPHSGGLIKQNAISNCASAP